MANKITYTPFVSNTKSVNSDIGSFLTPQRNDLVLPKKSILPTEIEPYKPKFEFKQDVPLGIHQFKSNDIQVGNTQPLLDQFANHGISLRITSGLRPGAMTKQGNTSWHSRGEALDITPIEGQTFDDLKQQIKANPTLVAWLQENGYGILDETTPEALAKTGGTGAHWHIGKDKSAVEGLRKLLSLQKGGSIPKLQKGNIIPDAISGAANRDLKVWHNTASNDYTFKVRQNYEDQFNWLNNWLSQRKDIYNQNLNRYSKTPTNTIKTGLDRIRNTDLFLDQSTLRGTHTYRNTFLSNEDKQRSTDVLRAKSRLGFNGVDGSIKPRHYKDDNELKDKIAKNVGGFYSTQTGTRRRYHDIFNIKGKNPYIYLTDADYDKNYTVPLHEQVHAGQFTEQESKIGSILGNKGTDKYYDAPNEIYSRLMQLRYLNKLDPKKKWNINEIKDIRNRIINPEWDYKQTNDWYNNLNQNNLTPFYDEEIFNRYDDDTILKLFNDVADSGKRKQDNYILKAQQGMKVPTMQNIIYKPYTIKKNETLSGIANSFGVPLTSIVSSNGIKDANKIKEGQTINIPIETIGYKPQYDFSYYINQPSEQFKNHVEMTPEQLKQREKEDELNISVGNIVSRSKKRGHKLTKGEASLLYDTFKDYKVPLNTVLELISSESGFNPNETSKWSSASGLFQVVQGTAKEILGEDAAREYKAGTRSFQDQVLDGIKILDAHTRHIKDGNYSYGRVKVALLAPNANLDTVIPDRTFETSLSDKMKKKLQKGKSTYRDLMNEYNKGTKN